MAKLIVNPDTAQAWEIALVQGIHVLGRDALQSTVLMDHPSVSPTHCQITVQEDQIRIVNLDPENPTRVDGELIEDVQLELGQQIQIGEVLLRFEAASDFSCTDPRSAEAAVPPGNGLSSAGRVLAGPVMCRYHSRVSAGNYCSQCQKGYCSLCVHQRGGGHYCRACGSLCSEIDTSASSEPEQEPSFYRRIPGIFAYPFRGNGVWMIVTGSVVYAIVDFASRFSLLVWALLVGYAVLYAQGIIHSTAQGEDRGPQWPDMQGDFRSTMMGALLQYLAVWFLCLAPSLALFMFGDRSELWTSGGAFLLLVIGLIYLPMAILAVAMFDSIAAINPVLVFPSIMRLPGAYVTLLGLFGVLLALSTGITMGLELLIPIPFLPGVISSLFSMYLLTVSARLLGVLYHAHRHEIGWFKS